MYTIGESELEKVTVSLDELFKEDLQDQEFQKVYRQQKPYYDLVSDIINRRIDLNLTQEDLAKRANTYQSRISKIESGEHDFRLSTIIQVAEALNTELSIELKPFEETTRINITEEFKQLLASRSKDPETDLSSPFAHMNQSVMDIEDSEFEISRPFITEMESV
jgi:transcriptional regulator with XRE-family HTH domain